MAKLMLELTADDIHATIPYALVCMTRESSVWDTGRRRRKWKEEFTEYEREACTRLFRMAHRWTLTTGVPEKVTMSVGTFDLWQKLGGFCGSL